MASHPCESNADPATVDRMLRALASESRRAVLAYSRTATVRYHGHPFLDEWRDRNAERGEGPSWSG